MNSITRSSKRCLGAAGIRPAIVAFIVAAVVVMMWGGPVQAQGDAQAGALLHVDAPAQTNVGGVIELSLRLEGAPAAVGGFEAEVLFDPARAEWTGFTPTAAQGDGVIGQLAAPLLTNGSAVGFYTCHTAACLAVGPVQAALTEPGVVAKIELVALAAGQLEIRLDHVQFVDLNGQPLAVTLAAPGIVIQVGDDAAQHAAPASGWSSPVRAAASAETAAVDVTDDGVVTHGDLMEVALAWESSREQGDACAGQEAAADVNRDGCVDILDVQAVAGRTGETEVPPGGTEVPGEGERPQLSPRLFLPFIIIPFSASDEAVEASAVLTFVVNSTGDQADQFLSDNKCKTAAGDCTLRAAIAQANAHPGPDIITFAIPGAGVQTIQLTRRLMALSDVTGATIVDGYTQPGALPNTDPLRSNAQIMVQLRGNGAEDFDALPITSAGNVVQGLAFFNLKRSLWIYGTGATDNVVAGNLIGTDATGTFKAAPSNQQAHGIHIEQGARLNRIGGVLPAERNVISGNARHGIGFWHPGTGRNSVLNNLVGLSPDGTRNLGNWFQGIDINFGASRNTIGGTNPGEHNVVSGNKGKGVEMSHGEDTTENQIVGNYIGTDLTGNAAPAYAINEDMGVSLKDRVSNSLVISNVIGNNRDGGVVIDEFGTCCLAGNVVQGNRIGVGVGGAAIPNLDAGVRVLAGRSRIGPGNIIANNLIGVTVEGDANDGNTITKNSIYDNVGLGIDLAPLGQINFNDDGDIDSGPNEQLNFPILNSATITRVTGTACITCVVELFVANSGAGNYGEGRTYVGGATVNPDGTFTATVSGAALGDYLTATATDAQGNTSEFSLNRVVTAPPALRYPIPGRIEIEDYRPGGQGIGYRDTTPGNSGGAYRNDDVDIQATTDVGGGYYVGWIAATEWMAYDVNVLTSGNYLVSTRVSALSAGRTFRLEIDGVNVTGPVAVPATGNWQVWANATISIPLTAGPHTLRFVANSTSFNVNYIDFTAQ